MRSGCRRAEKPVHEQREPLVQPPDQRHHDADEDQDDTGVAEKFAASRRDDLAKLDDDLAEEQGETGKRATPVGALLSRVRDDVLTGLVDHFACHTHNLSIHTSFREALLLQKHFLRSIAGRTGLEPATCGFGDRCSTN